MSEHPVTTDRSTQAALLALLDTMIADPYMFTPQVVASAAERARDMIVALDSSLTASEKDAARYQKLRLHGYAIDGMFFHLDASDDKVDGL